jgi:hypothetical protein
MPQHEAQEPLAATHSRTQVAVAKPAELREQRCQEAG